MFVQLLQLAFSEHAHSFFGVVAESLIGGGRRLDQQCLYNVVYMHR